MYNFQFSIPGLMELQTPISDDLTSVLKLAPHSQRDSLWVGIDSIGPITEGGAAMSDAAADARIEFSASSDGECARYILTTNPTETEGLINIVGTPADWLFSIPSQSLPLPVGLWCWTFCVTDVVDTSRVIYKGTLLVTP
jgi:hypothetical protein